MEVVYLQPLVLHNLVFCQLIMVIMVIFVVLVQLEKSPMLLMYVIVVTQIAHHVLLPLIARDVQNAKVRQNF